MISRSAFDQMVGPGLNKIFDEIYGVTLFIGGDTVKVTKGDDFENFIDVVQMSDAWETIVSVDAWLW